MNLTGRKFEEWAKTEGYGHWHPVDEEVPQEVKHAVYLDKTGERAMVVARRDSEKVVISDYWGEAKWWTPLPPRPDRGDSVEDRIAELEEALLCRIRDRIRDRIGDERAKWSTPVQDLSMVVILRDVFQIAEGVLSRYESDEA